MSAAFKGEFFVQALSAAREQFGKDLAELGEKSDAEAADAGWAAEKRNFEAQLTETKRILVHHQAGIVETSSRHAELIEQLNAEFGRLRVSVGTLEKDLSDHRRAMEALSTGGAGPAVRIPDLDGPAAAKQRLGRRRGGDMAGGRPGWVSLAFVLLRLPWGTSGAPGT